MLRNFSKFLTSPAIRRCSSFVNDYTYRTHNCGELRETDVGKQVSVCGWVQYKRQSNFLIVRDSYGLIQVYISAKDKQSQKIIKSLHLESVVRINGLVSSRPAKDKNPKMPTGDVEIQLKDLFVLNSATKYSLPIEVDKFQTASSESNRLQYRYLDLRRRQMQETLRFRARLISKMRRFLGMTNRFSEFIDNKQKLSLSRSVT